MTNLAALDLNLLVALEALLEEASVGRAAGRVALSQPAMSHALKRLRILFGDPLLVRVGARMELTSRGVALLHPVKDALSRVRNLLDGEKFEAASSARTFRLFLSDYAGDLLLSLLLKRLQKEAPGVCIQLQPGARGPLDPFELARTVDVAVACVPHSFKGFYQQRLFTDRDASVVRHGHPAAKRFVHAGEWLKARHVAVVGREFSEDPVDSWLRQEGCERRIALSVPCYVQALHIVAQSDLIAVIPERLIRAYATDLHLDVLPVPLDAGTFDEYLLHPTTSHADPGCIWLRTILQEIAKSFGPLESHHLRKRSSGPRLKKATPQARQVAHTFS